MYSLLRIKQSDWSSWYGAPSYIFWSRFSSYYTLALVWYDSLFAKPRDRYQPFRTHSKISYKVGNWHSLALNTKRDCGGWAFITCSGNGFGLNGYQIMNSGLDKRKRGLRNGGGGGNGEKKEGKLRDFSKQFLPRRVKLARERIDGRGWSQ